MKKVKKKKTSSASTHSMRHTSSSNWFACGVLLLVLAALLLAIASHNSFCYPFNDALQCQDLFTIGKSMLSGWVVYDDIFTRQGFLLCGIYALAALISSTSMIGVYVLEVLALWIGAIFVWKLARLFMSQIYALAGAILYMCILVTSPAFGTGGSAAEFVMPILCISLYFAIQLFFSDTYSGLKIMLLGAMGAIAFFISPAFTGFWIALFIVLVLQQLLARQWVNCLLNLVWFIMGAAIPTLLIMVYFIAMQALANLIEIYIKLNASVMVPMSFVARIQNAFAITSSLVLSNYVLAGCLVCSLGIAICTRSLYSLLFVVLGFACLSVSLCWSGYTSETTLLADYIFAVPGIVFVCWLFSWLFSKTGKAQPFLAALVFIASLAAGGWLVYDGGQWKDILSRTQEYPALELAKLIEESEDQTLLTYATADQGLYTAAGILPATYYFQMEDLADGVFADNLNVQNQYLEKEATEFVLTVAPEGTSVGDEELLKSHYDLFKTITQDDNGQEMVWKLYKRKTQSENS